MGDNRTFTKTISTYLILCIFASVVVQAVHLGQNTAIGEAFLPIPPHRIESMSKILIFHYIAVIVDVDGERCITAGFTFGAASIALFRTVLKQ